LTFTTPVLKTPHDFQDYRFHPRPGRWRDRVCSGPEQKLAGEKKQAIVAETQPLADQITN